MQASDFSEPIGPLGPLGVTPLFILGPLGPLGPLGSSIRPSPSQWLKFPTDDVFYNSLLFYNHCKIGLQLFAGGGLRGKP